MKIETEDFILDYNDRSELSYIDNDEDYIELLYNGNHKVFLKVYADTSVDVDSIDYPEYIIINHTIIYLHDLKEHKTSREQFLEGECHL